MRRHADDDWEAEVLPNGKVDVRQGGKSAAYDLDDLEEAAEFIARRGGRSTTVIDPTGYRSEVPLP